jgi:hypothetical protein
MCGGFRVDQSYAAARPVADLRPSISRPIMVNWPFWKRKPAPARR